MGQKGISQCKKKAEKDGGVVLFQDEVVFQQEGTIHRTWAPVGEGAEVTSQPVRKSAKVFGAIRIDAKEPKFHFRFETGRFNTETFTRYLQQLVGYYRPRGQKVFLILDNVSYHHAAQRWAIQHPEEIELHFLPPYSPELNPTEQVWRRTKRVATHNRHFRTLEDLREAILRRFNRYQGNPKSLSGIVKRWL
jgi:transposase